MAADPMFSHTTTGASGIDLMVNTISPPPPLQHLPVPVQGPIKALTRLFTNATPLAGQEIFLRGVRIEASRFPIDARVHPLSILSAKRGNEWDASELITVSNTVTESVPPGRRGGDEAEPV